MRGRDQPARRAAGEGMPVKVAIMLRQSLRNVSLASSLVMPYPLFNFLLKSSALGGIILLCPPYFLAVMPLAAHPKIVQPFFLSLPLFCVRKREVLAVMKWPASNLDHKGGGFNDSRPK